MVCERKVEYYWEYSALKQARRYEDLPYRDFHNKLGSFLARRGFSYEVIKQVVVRVWEEKNGLSEEWIAQYVLYFLIDQEANTWIQVL